VVRESDGAGVRFRVSVSDGPRRLAGLIEAVSACGVVEVSLGRPTLEHVFLHHTGHGLSALDTAVEST
jgi:hypothetical protein